ncbi:unnamed protein product [Parajaminaea phylloscopi]
MDDDARRSVRSPPLLSRTDVAGRITQQSRPASPRTGTGREAASPQASSNGVGSPLAGPSSGGGGLLGWMRTAFSGPLNSNKSVDSASPRSTTPRQSDRLVQDHAQHVSETSLPSRNLDAEFFGQRRRSTASSLGTTSTGHFSVTEDEYNSDDEGEELYAPFEPAEAMDSSRTPASDSSQEGEPRATDGLSSEAAGVSSTGMVRPTARRSVSLDHGDKEGLDAEIARLSLRQTEMPGSNGSRVVKDSSTTGAMATDVASKHAASPPRLTLTVPDSNTEQKLTSPLVAGWTSPESSPSDLPNLARTWSSETSTQVGDGESLEAATGVMPRQSRETIALGSRSVAVRSSEHDGAAGDLIPQRGFPAGIEEDWDESRAKTPKAFADVVAAQKATEHSNELMQRLSDNQARTPTNEQPPVLQEATDLHESATPTPKPDQGRRLFQTSSHGSQQRRVASEANAPGVLKAPTPVAPTARRRLFSGVRKRLDSADGSRDSGLGEDAGDEAAHSDASSLSGIRRNRAVSGSSASSFWKRTRKPSAAGSIGTSPSHRMSASSSLASGISIEVPDSEGGRSSAPNSRPASIAPSEQRSVGASSWGKTKRVKIKSNAYSLAGRAGPSKIKSRAKNKSSSDRAFSNLYLAQELYLGAPDPGHEALQQQQQQDDRASQSDAEFGRLSNRERAGLERPKLTTASSQSSLDSSVSAASSAMAFSATSHSTVGSYGAHGKKKATWAMKFSLDGRYLAIAGQDTIVRVYQVLDTPEQRLRELETAKAREGILEMAERMSMAGSRDSFGSYKKTTKLPENKEKDNILRPIPVLTSQPIREFRGHTSDVLSLDWSKGNFLLSSSMDKTVKIWHLSKPECLITFGHGDFVTSAVFHPRDDRFFLSGSLDGKLRLWNIASKKVQASADVPGLITAAAFSASGTIAIAGTFSGALLFYQTEDLTYQSSIAVRSSSGKNARGRKITGIEAVNMVSTNGGPGDPSISEAAGARLEERILISSNDSRIRVYSLTDKRLTSKYRASTYLNRTSQIRASTADDTFVVAGSESGEVYVWDTAREAVGLAALGKKATRGGSKSDGGVIGSETCEYWTAAENARPVTVAVLAPLKTHSYLAASEDPIEMHSVMSSHGRAPSSGTTALSALGLASALSAAMPAPLKTGSTASVPPPGWDPMMNRIVVSVDESQVVRIWRSVREPHVIGAA